MGGDPAIFELTCCHADGARMELDSSCAAPGAMGIMTPRGFEPLVAIRWDDGVWYMAPASVARELGLGPRSSY